jgi:glyoxylase-like metal-dependent hydrolase (beta-lactamase superfamily II)
VTPTTSSPIREILPGVFHFTQPHERIGVPVSSYYLRAEGVLIDPMTPAQGVEWFALDGNGPPTDVLLSCRHHYRHSADYVREFGVTVHCVSHGMHEFADRELPAPVQPFEFGDRLAGEVTAERVNAISPDETAFYIPTHSALACADGVIHYEPGRLSFVPDQYMDDPAGTKRGLLDSFAKLLELDFDNLLLAHGDPLIGEGRKRLGEFVERGS